jgi:hypothetical protein
VDLAGEWGGHSWIRLRRRCLHGVWTSGDRHRRSRRLGCRGPCAGAGDVRRIAALERPHGVDPDRRRLGGDPHAARLGARLGRGRRGGRRDRRDHRGAGRAGGGSPRPAWHPARRRSTRLRGPVDAASSAGACPAACVRTVACHVCSAAGTRSPRAGARRVVDLERGHPRNSSCRRGAWGGGATGGGATPAGTGAPTGVALDEDELAVEAASAATERSPLREAVRRAGDAGSAGDRGARDPHGAPGNRSRRGARTDRRGRAGRAENRARARTGHATAVDPAPRGESRPGRPPPAPPTRPEVARRRSGGAKARAYHGRP